MKRSAQKKITVENKILRYMRLQKGLSMREAGSLFGLSSSLINHLEHGRMDLPPHRVPVLVDGYGFTMEDFERLRSGDEEVPVHFRDECINIIEKLDETKLQAVYGLLKTFVPTGSAR